MNERHNKHHHKWAPAQNKRQAWRRCVNCGLFRRHITVSIMIVPPPTTGLETRREQRQAHSVCPPGLDGTRRDSWTAVWELPDCSRKLIELRRRQKDLDAWRRRITAGRKRR